jgi:Raf kinase inhibitor-like YbhB/YbcL family protein
MRQAFLLLGIMTLIVSVGAFIAFERAEAPSPEVPITTEVTPTSTMQFSLTSPVFEDGGLIPEKFTCDADNVSPELHIQGVPEGTLSLILVMDDPDIPESVKIARGIEKFNHWAVYNIPADTTIIPEDALIGTAGLNGRGEAKYTGPCPPDKEHRYFFRLYAVTGTLNFIKAPTLDEIETAGQGMAIASTTLMGRYNRKSN